MTVIDMDKVQELRQSVYQHVVRPADMLDPDVYNALRNELFRRMSTWALQEHKVHLDIRDTVFYHHDQVQLHSLGRMLDVYRMQWAPVEAGLVELVDGPLGGMVMDHPGMTVTGQHRMVEHIERHASGFVVLHYYHCVGYDDQMRRWVFSETS